MLVGCPDDVLPSRSLPADPQTSSACTLYRVRGGCLAKWARCPRGSAGTVWQACRGPHLSLRSVLHARQKPPLRVRAFSVVELVDFHRDGAALDDPALTVGFPEPPAAARTVLVEHLREVVRPAPQRMTFGVPYGVRDLVGLLDGAHAHRVR